MSRLNNYATTCVPTHPGVLGSLWLAFGVSDVEVTLTLVPEPKKQVGRSKDYLMLGVAEDGSAIRMQLPSAVANVERRTPDAKTCQINVRMVASVGMDYEWTPEALETLARSAGVFFLDRFQAQFVPRLGKAVDEFVSAVAKRVADHSHSQQHVMLTIAKKVADDVLRTECTDSFQIPNSLYPVAKLDAEVTPTNSVEYGAW